MHKIISMTIALLFSLEGFAMNNEWFQTWDRPEYQEWAKEIPEGYLLHIIRKEPGNYLAVQAKLIMGEKGLPGFEVIKQNNLASAQEAMKQIEFWEESQIAYP